MILSQLLQGVEISASTADLFTEISGVSYDSRTTQSGELFVAMTGYETDGHRFIPMAAEKGAVCVLCEKAPDREDIPYLLTPDSREALAVIGKNWFQNPAADMKLIGITGTNGKTTSTYLLKDILEHCLHAKVGLIGTNQNMIGAEILPTERTTPESFELQGLFRKMRDAGCSHIVMEVSSHALFLKRVYGVPFEVGVFTNLTQDHLDFHQTMEHYCDAKALLFRQCRVGVYNADDPWAGRVMAQASCQKVSVGEQNAELSAHHIRLDAAGVRFDAVYHGETTSVGVGIPGGFMVYNTLGVLAAAEALGVPIRESAAVLRHTAHVKGRVEPVPVPGDYTMLIDYAHTPDALQNVLSAVRDFAQGRVVVLFGCGGDRDRSKRPLMGAAAAALADLVIVTSDNPRTENPRDIIDDILVGMRDAAEKVVVVENRVDAIHYAMDHALPGDVVVLAGKGHETYQIVGREKRHLDEREIVAAYAIQRKERT